MATEGGNRRVSRAGGLVVRPQPIRLATLQYLLCQRFGVILMSLWSILHCFYYLYSDKSYVESVVSFLHDVVPQVQVL